MESGRIKRIEYSRKFLRALSKLPERIIEQAESKEKVFRENPFHASLRTHKLSGKEKGVWAFWINYSYRIKFIFLAHEEVLFLEIGTHTIYS